MSYDDLSKSLAFQDGRPFYFSAHFIRPQNSKTPPAPFNLFWHQLAGVHLVIRENFSAKPLNTIPGMLIADEVGLGKTFQSAAIMSFLTERQQAELRGYPPPPLIGAMIYLSIIGIFANLYSAKTPYLGDNNALGDHPHLIIAPVSLTRQWEDELKSVLKPGSFDIMCYPSSRRDRQAFWGDNSSYRKSSVPPSRRIIIASHPVNFVSLWGGSETETIFTEPLSRFRRTLLI